MEEVDENDEDAGDVAGGINEDVLEADELDTDRVSAPPEWVQS